MRNRLLFLQNPILILCLLFQTLGICDEANVTPGSDPRPPESKSSVGSTGKTLPFNAMLIGWDGVQRNHLIECLARNECPNLVALAKEGALMKIDISTGATDTKAGWSEILTGYSHFKTGVYDNNNYQPIPEGYSVFERIENEFGPENVVTVFLAGKRNHVGARGPHILYPEGTGETPVKGTTEADFERHKIVGTDEANSTANELPEGGRRMAGEPHYHASQHVDLFVNGLGFAPSVGQKALETLDTYKDKPFFFFVQFGEPDNYGHKHGENSEEYTKGIMTDDEWLGKIVAKLKELGLYEKTKVYVVSDHGFNEGTNFHATAAEIWFAGNDPLVGKVGDRKDITPTILNRLGFDLDKIEPPLEGKPLLRSEKCELIW